MIKRFAMLVIGAAMMLSAAASGAADKSEGVYVKMLSGMKADITQSSAKVEDALKAAGFDVIAAYDNGAPEGCRFRAHTIIFTKPDYAAKVMAGGPDKAFGLPLRLALYEDEKGLNLAMVNPVSMNRSFFLNNSMDNAGSAVVDEVASALKGVGPVKKEQIGQMRSEGEIRGIGGGKFPGKMEDVAVTSLSVDDAADALAKGFADKSGYYTVYTYKPTKDVAVVGVTNTSSMEGRAFYIAGEKRSDDDYMFPGMDHAAAFPIEIVIYNKNGKNTAVIVDEMWRMKLYFEDAGMWAFMKNMGMPGDIQDEVVKGIKSSLK